MRHDIGQPNDGPNNRDNSYNIWKSIGFFNGGDHLIFIFKKTEKISSALYLVSGLLKDTEPVKWELREKAMSLLLSTVALNSNESADKNSLIQSFFSDALETVALLNVSFFSGLISEMNCEILKHEIEAIVSLLKAKVFEDAASAGYVLSDSFFTTDFNFKSDSKLEGVSKIVPSPTADVSLFNQFDQELKTFNFSKTKNGKNSKNQNIQSNQSVQSSRNNNEINTHTQKNQKEHIKDKIAVKEKKDGRKTAIISLLRKKSPLTIKDFSEAIKDCSEKTIQRELLELVENGIVRKEGERRWSTYSLN